MESSARPWDAGFVSGFPGSSGCFLVASEMHQRDSFPPPPSLVTPSPLHKVPEYRVTGTRPRSCPRTHTADTATPWPKTPRHCQRPPVPPPSPGARDAASPEALSGSAVPTSRGAPPPFRAFPTRVPERSALRSAPGSRSLRATVGPLCKEQPETRGQRL